MEVRGITTVTVNIDPLTVIEGLIERTIGYKHWIIEEKDKFYKVYEDGCGGRSYDVKEEITKELYDYVTALKHCITYLLKNK